jgi:hypothetical protein
MFQNTHDLGEIILNSVKKGFLFYASTATNIQRTIYFVFILILKQMKASMYFKLLPKFRVG